MSYKATESLSLHPHSWNLSPLETPTVDIDLHVHLQHDSSLLIDKSHSTIHMTPFPSLAIQLFQSFPLLQRVSLQSQYHTSHHSHSFFSKQGPSGHLIELEITKHHGTTNPPSTSTSTSTPKSMLEAMVHHLDGWSIGCTSTTRSTSTILPRGKNINASLHSDTYQIHIPTVPGMTCAHGYHRLIQQFLPCSFHKGVFSVGPSLGILMGTSNGSERLVSMDLHRSQLQSQAQSQSQTLQLRIGVEYAMRHLSLPMNQGGYSLDLSSVLLGSIARTMTDSRNHLALEYLEACPLVDSSTLHTILSPMTLFSSHKDYDTKEYEPTITFHNPPHSIQYPTDDSTITSVQHNVTQIRSPGISLQNPFFTVTPFPQNSTLPPNSDTTLPLPSLQPNSHTNADANANANSNAQQHWEFHRRIQPHNGMSPSTGTIITTLQNHHKECSTHVSLEEVYPMMILQPQFHTLHIWMEPQKEMDNAIDNDEILPPPPPPSSYTIQHYDSYTILQGTNWTIPPATTLTLSIDYQTHFIPFHQFPADPNRGYDLPPSLATGIVTCPSSSSVSYDTDTMTLYSPSLLLLPPVPDMSMPFNVISLTCTVYAFLIGTLMNILIKRGTERVKLQFEGRKVLTKLDRWKEKVKGRLDALKRILGGRKGGDSDENGNGEEDETKEEHVKEE